MRLTSGSLEVSLLKHFKKMICFCSSFMHLRIILLAVAIL